jgi:hypothetical protein
MSLTNEYLRYVSEFEQNDSYREMAKELLALRLLSEMQEEIVLQKEKEEKENDSNYSICDDCDMTYPCCNKCVGA